MTAHWWDNKTDVEIRRVLELAINERACDEWIRHASALEQATWTPEQERVRRLGHGHQADGVEIQTVQIMGHCGRPMGLVRRLMEQLSKMGMPCKD